MPYKVAIYELFQKEGKEKGEYDSTRSVNIYEQTVEELDVTAVIDVVNHPVGVISTKEAGA